nr:unnamed protein product [Digitaria exilis]
MSRCSGIYLDFFGDSVGQTSGTSETTALAIHPPLLPSPHAIRRRTPRHHARTHPPSAPLPPLSAPLPPPPTVVRRPALRLQPSAPPSDKARRADAAPPPRRGQALLPSTVSPDGRHLSPLRLRLQPPRATCDPGRQCQAPQRPCSAPLLAEGLLFSLLCTSSYPRAFSES